ncbi:hypothetical protein K523DRAFT_419943 [Schizophyllum commune Tattone D]|nr:hypothetical protein K523DRAFT_419943 [Schizophyllum commune Tattone D]
MDTGVRSLVYGLQVALSITAISFLARRRGRSWISALSIINIFLMSTAIELMMMRILRAQVALFATSAPRQREPDKQMRYEIMISGACLCINYILSDALVVWRAWVLWPHSRVARAALTMGMVGTAVGSVFRVIHIGSQARDLRRISVFTLESLTFTLPILFTNALATALVGSRLWEYRRDVAALLEPISGRSRVGRVLLLLVESGVMFCAICVRMVSTPTAHDR